MVTRGLVSRQGSRLISMETAEAMKTCTSKPKVFVRLVSSEWPVFTWVCMAQRVEGGCEGPEGQSSWWGFLKEWLIRYLGFWLAADQERRDRGFYHFEILEF